MYVLEDSIVFKLKKKFVYKFEGIRGKFSSSFCEENVEVWGESMILVLFIL